ncbi:MAG: HAMP domain-containing histidine kinase [Gemmatimonadota bacterium]|nr:HAMP domain-containing histidine kinase [Gemmatimonadota bacterium]
MTIRAKLALALCAITVTLLVPLLLALNALTRVHDTNKELKRRELPATMLLTHTRGATDELRVLETRMGVLYDSSTYLDLTRGVDALNAKADSLDQFHLVDAKALHGALAELRRVIPREFELGRSGARALADTMARREWQPAIARVDTALASTERELRERTTEQVDLAEEASSSARHVAFVALLLAIAIAAAIGIVLWRAINHPIGELEHGMAAVADGNFTYRLPVSAEREDEFGALAASFASMTQQLAQLDRLRAEFISIASHELKTPINVISGYLQLVQEGIYGPVTEKQQEILRTIDNQTRSLARLVHQLLDVSRFEAGGGKVEPRPMSLDRFLEDLDTTFEVLAMQKGITFRIERSGDLPDEVAWDRDRINEVLGNLLANAFKFTPRAGTVELLVSAADHSVRIDVHDTGAGINPAQLPHIFEKFFQADNQGSATHAGTGLGLAIAKQIVVAHQGAIEVESAPGDGTTFSITLPTRVAPRASSPHIEVPAGVA